MKVTVTHLRIIHETDEHEDGKAPVTHPERVGLSGFTQAQEHGPVVQFSAELEEPGERDAILKLVADVEVRLARLKIEELAP